MNRRTVSILICALLVSVCASYLVYVNAAGPRAPRQEPKTRIVVAARDLEIGTLLQASDLRTADWSGTPPKGWPVRKEDVVNRGVVSAIYEGEPIAPGRLAASGSGGGLASVIPNGMRACAVKVDQVVGVAGFVLPGMRVDVLTTGLPPGGQSINGPAARTLLQNIQVLSAGANMARDKDGKPQEVQVVNLLVSPDQAEILSLADKETHIQLILRNPTDMEVTKPPGTAMAELFGAPAAAPTPRPATQPTPRPPAAITPVPVALPPAATPAVTAARAIEILNGPKRSVASFPSSAPSGGGEPQ
jgi:pilus assembly protein CpaB